MDDPRARKPLQNSRRGHRPREEENKSFSAVCLAVGTPSSDTFLIAPHKTSHNKN